MCTVLCLQILHVIIKEKGFAASIVWGNEGSRQAAFLWGLFIFIFFSRNIFILCPLEADLGLISGLTGLPWWLNWYRIHLQRGRPGFDPWVGKIQEGLPNPVFWPGEFNGLYIYSPWGGKELDTTEQLSETLFQDWLGITALTQVFFFVFFFFFNWFSDALESTGGPAVVRFASSVLVSPTF